MLQQKYGLLASLFELEEKKKRTCTCKGVCRIKHDIHNWVKPEIAETLNKSRNILGMQVECGRCDDKFGSMEELENHLSRMHPIQIIRACTSNPWGLTFLDINNERR